MKILNLNKKEKRSFILILISSIFYGVFLGILRIRDIIARKALNANDLQLSFIVMIFPVANFLSIWWGKILENSKSKSKYFLMISIFGRLFLVAGVWVVTANQFLVLLAFVLIFHAAFIPARNSIYQTNIREKNRGQLFGIALSVSTLILMAFSYYAGRVLDASETNFHYLIAGVGILGFFNSFILYFIKNDTPDNTGNSKNIKKLILDPVKRMKKILITNKEFAVFELSFILYGMGFILMMYAIPIYLVDILKLTYTTSFLAKAVVANIGILLLAPFMGKLHDRWHPNLFNVFAFLLLITYPLFLLISKYMPTENMILISVYGSFLFFGIARAAVSIAWNMSSVYFAGEEDSSMYQSIHVTFTGIRGVLAPLLGFAIKKVFDVYGIFIAAILFFILAASVSYGGYKKRKLLAKD